MKVAAGLMTVAAVAYGSAAIVWASTDAWVAAGVNGVAAVAQLVAAWFFWRVVQGEQRR